MASVAAEGEEVKTPVSKDDSREERAEEDRQDSASTGSQSDGEDEGEVSDGEVRKNGSPNATPNADVPQEGPPLPNEDVPPLPAEPPPGPTEQDDGWAPVWEETAQAFYFYNRFTGATQWTNPRVPDDAAVAQPGPPGVDVPLPATDLPASSPPTTTGYNPAIHGDYDPTAWYAQPEQPTAQSLTQAGDPTASYAATAAFNRFTGRYQVADLTPDNFNDENKSKRQMNAFFDVDAAANSHDGRSLKAERSGKKLSKTELKQFKEKRRAKKEEKRRAWLRD
ncbi:uncharacterized protein L3040_002614 [Drepanopeziza brunnea f. sp. 'multigermtubi']|uniref:WW domain protein n=1 Tax=Marssonina brunnea f. sp. multigermtubi (strain MB_m1) TaxID=1072389 RepID=K1X2Q5_MARBU|nr:WW domain protein [Drepanopeziza brunnea f. sp. 'multigermtubi' MB_m1]EKD19506.1 WW domain protein [Drepanopeziza brunnea f. sp. 'multigermtubi' MB_m1]KAJ5050743.1 hypothetical protein L3040_002614 [Drepanopeziza brunnea f. sp. 'multigermtubi']